MGGNSGQVDVVKHCHNSRHNSRMFTICWSKCLLIPFIWTMEDVILPMATKDDQPIEFNVGIEPDVPQEIQRFFQLKTLITKLQAELSLNRLCIRSFRKYRVLNEEFQKSQQNGEQSEKVPKMLAMRSRQCDLLSRRCRFKAAERNARSVQIALSQLYEEILKGHMIDLDESIDGKVQELVQNECEQSMSIGPSEIITVAGSSNEPEPPFFICPVGGCGQIFPTRELKFAHSCLLPRGKRQLRAVPVLQQATVVSSKRKVGRPKKIKVNSRKSAAAAKRQLKQRKVPEKIDKNTLKYACPVEGCSFAGKYRATLQMHSIKHTEIRTFKCEQCSKAFKDIYRLRSHQTIHNGQRFFCSFEDCDKSYSSSRTLNNHIESVHTKQAAILRCTWPSCDYQTHRKDSLRRHFNVHSGDRPYKCIWPDCGKAFKSLSTQYDHILMHKNERKYKCQFVNICNYSCNILGNLRKHEAIHARKGHSLVNNSSLSPDDNEGGSTDSNLVS